jgi:hypothetical protein
MVTGIYLSLKAFYVVWMTLALSRIKTYKVIKNHLQPA